MAVIRPLFPEPAPALHDRAADNLRFIRETMERASSFTAVPGWGLAGGGVTAFATAWLASRQPTHLAWLTVWLAEAVLAFTLIMGAMALKGRRAGEPLFSGPGRKFLLSFAPPVIAGALLTLAIARAGAFGVLPGVWLLCFGAGVTTGGTFSVRSVPVMGCAFMAVGAVALATPPALGDLWMAVGFGGLLIAFGAVIARQHGG